MSLLKVNTDRVLVSSEKFIYPFLPVVLGNESPTRVLTWSLYKVCMHWYGLLTCRQPRVYLTGSNCSGQVRANDSLTYRMSYQMIVSLRFLMSAKNNLA